MRINKATPMVDKNGAKREPDDHSFFKWTVELVVHETWVADGFDLDDERAYTLLQNEVGYAFPGEISARVVKAPPRKQIRLAQGYTDEDGERPSGTHRKIIRQKGSQIMKSAVELTLKRMGTLSITDHDQLNKGFESGAYANAYETEDYEKAVEGINGSTGFFRVAFLLGFFATYELHEIPEQHQEEAGHYREVFRHLNTEQNLNIAID